MDAERPSPLARPGAAVAGSLVPCVAFVLAMLVADLGRGDPSVGLDVLAAVPIYLGFVALPSLLPIAVARTVELRLAVLAAMTAVAVLAGAFVATTDDAQAGLAVLWVPFVAIPLGTVIWVGQTLAERRSATASSPTADPPEPVTPWDRLAALAIDVALLGAVLVVPLTMMSHAGREVAATATGLVLSTLYLAVLVAWRGRTVGQALVRLAVVDAETLGRVPFGRALLRSLIIVVEVAAAWTIVLAPVAFAELLSVGTTGRSLTDRLLRTSVLPSR